MDEGTGTNVLDSGTNKAHGSFNAANGATWSDRSGSGGMYFTSLTSYVSVDGLWADGATSLTICAWMKARRTDGDIGLAKEVSGSQVICLDRYVDSSFYAMVRKTPNSYGNTIASFVDTNWHHIVMVYDAGLETDALRLKCYVDGIQQALGFGGLIDTSMFTNSANFRIGYHTTGHPFFEQDGFIDNVIFSLRAFSSNEQYNIWNATK